jgi:malto-oligosyltrehalose trehalohydrolase
VNDAALRTSARSHLMPFGAELRDDGTVRFSLWAPAQKEVGLRLAGRAGDLLLEREKFGWHSLVTEAATAGSLYQFVLSDGLAVPDPASRFQPRDVHGPSEVIDPRQYQWHDADWRGRPWHEAVIYELHVGCFTAAGNYDGVRERLGDLANLGITAIELMPLADFPGRRNWGYDGVLPFAPDSSYGHPKQLKALIDAAHAVGIMVLLDVVYNHFGPDGNYLSLYAPQFFTERHHTPWGAAINFDGSGSRTVRDYFIHNALYWLTEFHFDGLRFDAVHAILDDSPTHILAELAQRVRTALPGRAVHLVLENEHNEASLLERSPGGEPPLYNAQWNDDVHHVLHVAATADSEGYYEDYIGRTRLLGRALAEGFAFQGEPMPYRGAPRGEPSAQLPPSAFIAFLQNHDQIGNRALGERITALASQSAIRAVTAVYLLLPQIPMIFMGEEWQCPQPFLFFCDFDQELGVKVLEGRRAEFARFEAFRDESARAQIPDPRAEDTFRASQIDWTGLTYPDASAAFVRYRELLAVRRRHISPLLPTLTGAGEYRELASSAVLVRWIASSGAALTLVANLKNEPALKFPTAAGHLLWQEGHIDAAGNFGPWSVRWSLLA